MNNAEIIKVDDSELLNALKIRNNRIIIKKDSDKVFRLFYDYQDNNNKDKITRLEIQSSLNAYTTTKDISKDILLSDIKDIHNQEPTTIQIGAIISNEDSIGIITKMFKDSDDKNKVSIKQIYTTNDNITWGTF